MPLTVTATVTISSAPESFDANEVATTVFQVCDAQLGQYSRQDLCVDRLQIGDVVCREGLAHAALRRLRPGDRIVVVGTLELRVPLDACGESSWVLLSIEAEQIGLALAS